MTKPYRLTPEQWESIELYAEDNDHDACLLELRARIEALEAAQQPRVFTAEEVAPIVTLSSPAGSLVVRVQRSIDDLPSGEEARAAILEVAAWLRDDAPQSCPLTARWLEQEANR